MAISLEKSKAGIIRDREHLTEQLMGFARADCLLYWSPNEKVFAFLPQFIDLDEIYKKSAFNGTFVLNGVNPELDGTGCLLDTDCGIITLQIGKNDFEVENFTGTISFDFPMWWLS